jgi:hypothetical protein
VLYPPPKRSYEWSVHPRRAAAWAGRAGASGRSRIQSRGTHFATNQIPGRNARTRAGHYIDHLPSGPGVANASRPSAIIFQNPKRSNQLKQLGTDKSCSARTRAAARGPRTGQDEQINVWAKFSGPEKLGSRARVHGCYSHANKRPITDSP